MPARTSPPAIAEWILGSMSSGIVAIDERGAVVMLNAGAQQILGCPDGELSAAFGTSCREVLASQPGVAELLLDTLDGRAALSRAELVLEDVSGSRESTIGFTLTPIRDDGAAVRGAAMIFRDLAPFERMDEQERLRERLAALGQMAAGLAHEIRNPLAGMEVIAGLLERRLTGRDEELSLVTQLVGELRSVADTVTDCLEFVRPISLERTRLDPVTLVDESLATALSRLPFEGAIERSYEEELPELLAEPDLLRVVVTNLIVNAIEAMAGDNGGREKRLGLAVRCASTCRPDRSIHVRADRRAGPEQATRREIVINVSDSGPGVPAEHREKIFYPFFTTRQSGSGVGLATAQKIVASHRGTLELDSGVVAGSSFFVRLPVFDEKGDDEPWEPTP